MAMRESLNSLEMNVFLFCRNPRFSYISESAKSLSFKAGKIGQLSFHKRQNQPEETLRTEVELFTNQLSDYLWALRYDEAPKARMHIRDMVKKKDEPMKKLLDVIKGNFSEREAG